VILNCATPPGKDGCAEGELEWALERAFKGGLPDNTCQNYRGAQEICDSIHICVNCFGTCSPVLDYVVYNVSSYSQIEIHPDITMEIKKNGPVACKFRADESLPSGKRDFHGVVVGYNFEYYIVNPNFGSFVGNDTVRPGFLMLPADSLIECWVADPNVEGKGSIAQLSTTGEVIPKIITSPLPPAQQKKHDRNCQERFSKINFHFIHC